MQMKGDEMNKMKYNEMKYKHKYHKNIYKKNTNNKIRKLEEKKTQCKVDRQNK